MDNKPDTMSMKDWLIRNMSTKMNIPERIIEAVINHQMYSARSALDTCNSMEFGGWGKFYFNQNKAKYKMIKLEKQKAQWEKTLNGEKTTERYKKSLEFKIGIITQQINELKPKLND